MTCSQALVRVAVAGALTSGCGAATTTTGQAPTVPVVSAATSAPATPATPPAVTRAVTPAAPAAPSAAPATSPTAPATPAATPATPGAVTAAPVPLTRSLGAVTVVLDAGHNGGNATHPREINRLVEAGGFRKACNTVGAATDAGYAEHSFAWDVVLRTAQALRQDGLRVVLTRSSDTGVGPCIDQRASVANRAGARLVVSVHADGGPASGTGFHVIEPALAPDGGNAAILNSSDMLARSLRRHFLDGTREPYADYLAGGTGLARRSDLGGLNLARIPAAFLECANMRNAGDAGRVSSPRWRQLAALAVARAIVDYLQHEGA